MLRVRLKYSTITYAFRRCWTPRCSETRTLIGCKEKWTFAFINSCFVLCARETKPTSCSGQAVRKYAHRRACTKRLSTHLTKEKDGTVSGAFLRKLLKEGSLYTMPFPGEGNAPGLSKNSDFVRVLTKKFRDKSNCILEQWIRFEMNSQSGTSSQRKHLTLCRFCCIAHGAIERIFYFIMQLYNWPSQPRTDAIYMRSLRRRTLRIR